ncbi:MAG: TlyA family RNA methyltransferase [Bacillota bacterium]
MDDKKKRLDLLLVEKGYFTNRNRARSEIMAGNVFVNGRREDKPGTFVRAAAQVELQNRENPYVSRGGLKLRKALEHFSIDLQDKVVLDLGASTGGFTQCALEAGARKVFALDVGYGQLAWELRTDPRVISMERFNARFLKKDDLPSLPHLATIDVSFISLKIIIPVVAELAINEIICLVKPQFEALPEQVGKKGVVKDPQLHVQILSGIVKLARRFSYEVRGLTFSPIKGPKGNIEYLLYLSFAGEKHAESGKTTPASCAMEIRSVVSQAWETLQDKRT